MSWFREQPHRSYSPQPAHWGLVRIWGLMLWGFPFFALLYWASALSSLARDGWSWGDPMFVFYWLMATAWTLLDFVVLRRHRSIKQMQQRNNV
jgi:hypothetical protein